MSSGACDPHGISYAWIDPHGKVHETVHGHEEWAWRFIAAFPDMLLEAERGVPPRLAGAVLLRRGWIRVANFTNMSVWQERTPSAAAWKAMVDLVVKCSMRHRDIDPFEPLIYVEETGSGGQAEVYSIADFLEKFAGKRESELFFESLMSRTASGQACSVIATSWAWVSPFGKLYIVRQTHEEWAARYVQQSQEASAYRDWLKVHPSKEGGVSRYLLRTGWIRATNAYALEVGVPHRVSEAAWKVMADNLIACALQRGIDPETPAAVLVATENGENAQHSVAEFVERYGNAQQLTRLLEGALKNRRFARTDVVGKPLVERLRKDVLMLAKSAESVRTLEEAQIVKKGLRRWLVSYERLLAGIREDLEGRIREAKAYAQTGYKGPRPVSDVERAQWHLDNMKSVWILRSEISSGLRVPELKGSEGGSFEEPESVRARIIAFYREKYPEKDAEGETDSYLSRHPPWTRQQAEQAAVAQWLTVAVPWARRVREKARAAWTYLHDLSAWTEFESGSGGGGLDRIEVVMPEDEHIILEGFKVVFQGFAESGSDRQEALGKLKEALRRYRKNVSDRLPLILRKQLPFVVEWVFDPGANSDYAGQYHVDHIRLSPWAFASDVNRTVHTLVHEMGHHLYRTVLSDSATQFWNTAVKGDYGDLDLRHALKVLESLGIIYSEDKVLAEADPVLYLQLGTLQNDINYKQLDLWDVKSIREYIEAGNNPVVRVPRSPITGYSGKNSEEAFCEAVARLVAYGPMTLPDTVLGWLKVVLPNIRIGSEQPKVAARPIKVDRQAVVGLTHRLIDQMREEGRGREDEKVGIREAILMDTVHVLTVEGQKKEVTVILTSGKGSARPFVSGGGFGTVKDGPHKGTPIILIQLDGRETWGTYGDTKKVGMALLSTLMHEITHAMDKVAVKDTDPTFQGGVIPNASDLDLHAYYNHPNEVRAYMREIYEELRPLVILTLTHEKYRKDWTLAEAITKIIGGIDRWRRMEPYLTQQNRNRILKGIVTAFEDEGLGKTAGISLTRKPGRSSNASAFLSDYDALTYGNPIDDRVRVWSYVSDDGERVPLITTELQSTPHQEAPIWLKSIASPERQGSGQASYVLKEIARLADKHGVAIWLTPKPFGFLPNGLKMADLKGWYRRHGWVPKGSVWIREPVTSPTDRVASASGSNKTATRPIRIDRVAVDDLTRRIVDGMRRESKGREDEVVGERSRILDEWFSGTTVTGETQRVMIFVASGRGARTPFVSNGVFGRIPGGSHKGTPFIIVVIDGRETWGTFGKYEVVGKYLNNLLVHEVTHAMDLIGQVKPSVARAKDLTSDEFDLVAYYNDPHEVRAFMRQLYEEIRPLVVGAMGKERLRKEWDPGGAVVRFLQGSDLWNRMSRHLTRQNRNRILKGIVTAFEDEGLSMSHDPASRVASAWLARTAARPRYQEKKEVPKADGSGTATVYVYSDRQVANRHRDKAERVEGLRGKIGDLRKRLKKDLEAGL